MSRDLQAQLIETQHQLEVAQQKIVELEAQLLNVPVQHIGEAEKSVRLAQRLDGLHQLDRIMLSADSLESLAELALNHVIRLVPCFRASISTVNLTAKTVYILAVHTFNSTAVPARRTYPLDENYVAPLHHEPYVIINNMEQSSNPQVAQLYAEGIRSILLVGLRSEGRLIGLLSIHAQESNYFNDEIVEIVLEVANQIAIGVYKAEMSDSLVRYAKRMELLHAIDLGIIEGGSIKALIEKTFKQLRQFISCERIGVGVVDASNQHALIYVSSFDYDSVLGEGVRIPIPPGWFDGFDARGMRLIQDLHQVADSDQTYKRMVNEGFQSQLQVLLKSQTKIIGIVGFSSRQLGFFTEEHQQVAIEVSNQVAIAIHQMQLAEALENYSLELEQRVAERTAELQSSKDRMEAILNNSLDGILLIDRDLTIQQSNPAFKKLLSIKFDSDQKITLLDLIPFEDAQQIRMTTEKAVTEQVDSHVEIRTKRADGTDIDMEFSVAYIPGDGLVSTVHDITQRKQAEEALRRALEKEKEVVEAKSRFVSVASHEFRTPLASILTTTELLLTYRQKLNTEQVEQRLDGIRQQVNHMRAIMDNVLQLAKSQSGNLELRLKSGDLATLCRNILSEFENHAENQGRFVYTSSPISINVLFDEQLMRQVITNLISNAVKYSSPNTSISVTLTRHDAQIILEVSDQGIGIPKEDLKRLFEPFHRASNVGSINGTGLGLSITKEIVEAHGGSIHVESQIGQGTTFIVFIPIS